MGVVGEEEDVVNNLAIAGLDKTEGDAMFLKVGKFLTEECLPLLTEYEHKGGVAGRCVDRSKGHDVEGVEDTLGSSEAEFGPVGVADSYLMKAGLGVDTNPVQFSSAWGEVIDGFITTGNGKVVNKGDGVEAAVGDAEAPDEVGDVGCVLLVWFGGENDHGEPTGKVGKATDPTE